MDTANYVIYLVLVSSLKLSVLIQKNMKNKKMMKNGKKEKTKYFGL